MTVNRRSKAHKRSDVGETRGAGSNNRLIIAGLIATIVVLVAAWALWPDGDTEASLTAVPSLEYEYSPNHLHGIGLDHENDRLLLASHFGLFALEGEQLYQVGDSRDDLMGFSANPHDPSEIYVSGHPMGGGNLGVMRSTDAGLTFERIFTGIAGESVDFHSMTVSGANPNWLYGAFMGQIYRTEDGGDSWVALQPEGLPERGACWGAPCLAASSDDPATIYAGTEHGLMVSTDRGESWDVLNAEVGQVAAVKVDPQDHARIVAFTEQLGLAESQDAGESWQSRHGDLSTDGGGFVFAIALDRNDAGRIVVATTNNEVYESRDGGDTWQRIV